MTYKEKYYEIINTGYKTKPETGYYEGHHIVPKSICPLLKKTQNNIVYLTAKNHFLAHYYIWKYFKEELHEKKWARKMCFALNMMKRQLMKSNDIERLSDLYEEVRREMSKIVSKTMKGNKWNRGKHLPESTKNKIRNKLKGKSKSEEHKQHMKGRNVSLKLKKMLSEKMKGNKLKLGYTTSEETKKKIGNANRGRKQPKELIDRRVSKRIKAVLQYDKKMNFIREWKSTIEIQRELGCYHSNISDCCNGKRKSVYKFIWIWKEDICYFF